MYTMNVNIFKKKEKKCVIHMYHSLVPLMFIDVYNVLGMLS